MENTFPSQDSDENKRLQAKKARTNRKLALKKSLTSASSGGSSSKPRKKKSERNEDLDIIYTPNDVKLRIVLRKRLSCTDVSDLGRIVLPKRDVEQNLPIATNEGVGIVMKEVSSNAEWGMIFRYWANIKGNIYVLDQCGDFIKENFMEVEDQLNVYKDDQRNLYFTVRKRTAHDDMQEKYNLVTTEEEESSLRILVEELKHKDEDEPNTLTTLYNNGGGN